MKFVLTICFLAVIASQAAAQDYCNAELCPEGNHIACNNKGQFGPQCPPEARVVNITPQKDLILQMINVRRNIVANGKLAGFEPATRMGTVAWSEDLQRLAELNVKRCVFSKDECRNTYTFKNVDQKLFQQFSTGPNNINYREHIIKMIQKYYTQHANTDAATMATFAESTSAAPYNAFAIIVNERLTHVGCASATFKRSGTLYVNTFCNFSTNNIEGNPVYEAGETASGCTTGPNSAYPGLCSASEEIDPNPV